MSNKRVANDQLLVLHRLNVMAEHTGKPHNLYVRPHHEHEHWWVAIVHEVNTDPEDSKMFSTGISPGLAIAGLVNSEWPASAWPN